MKKFYCLLALLFIGASNPFALKAQLTTVFIDTFDGEFFAGPGGDPSITMTPNAGPSGAYPFSYSQIGAFDWFGTALPAGYLTNFANDDFSSPASTWQWTSGSLSGYAAPWAPKLNLNTGLVTWTFNMHITTPQTGNFGISDDEAIVMLVGTDDRLFTSGIALPTQGYGVTMTSFTSGAPYGIRLVKFGGALSGSAPGVVPVDVITPSSTFPGLASPTQYLSVRVTYDPSSDRWNLYVRDDGFASFANPATGVNTLVGTAIDNTYTSTTVTKFGFYSHFDMSTWSGSISKYAYFDNFKATVSCTMPVNGNPNLCVGGTTTLTDATLGGTWSSLNTAVATVSAGGVVTAVGGTGTAIVRYQLSPTCWADTPVVVHPLPTITGPLNTCVGQTTIVNATPTGGTWATSTTTYGTIDATTGGFTGLPGTGGTTTISYTDGNGCLSTATGTVNPLPSAIGGTLTVCEALGTTTLTNGTPLGTWSTTSSSFSVGASTGVVTGATPAGTGTVTYTAPTGCYVTAVVTVNPQPNPIVGPTAVCQGSTITLTNATSGGGTWSISPTANATITTFAGMGVVTGVTGGTTATVTFTSTTNGCPRTSVITVNSLPPATTGTFSVCVGSSSTLANTGGPGTWTTFGGNANVNASGVVSGVSAGTQRITFTRTSTGCFVTTLVTVNALPANITPGSPQVCVNSTINLSSSPLGGTWSSSNTAVGTISASTMPGVAGGISAPGGIAGTTTISYTLSTGCARSVVLTVNPLPSSISGTTSVCAGASSTLSASPAGGTWSTTPGTGSVTVIAGPTAGTGVITGLVVGTSTVSYRLSTGCYTTVIANTNLTPSPVITPIGDTMLCPGGFVVLTASTGTSYTYQWHESGVPIAGATNATYTTSTPGSYDVFISNGIGCAATAAPMSVSLNPATATITPPGTGLAACSGGSVVLTANTGVGLSYQWLVGSPAIAVPGATSSSYSYNGLTTNNVKLIVTNSSGCSAEDSVTVTINPLPSAAVVVTGPTVFCQGGTTTLSAASVPGYTYQWFNSGTPIPGATSANYFPTTSGNYSVTISNSGTMCSATSSGALITVNPLPDVTVSHIAPTVFCPGGSVGLTAAVSAAYVYQWYVGGAPISGATNVNYSATSTGGYRVKITNTLTGCMAMTGADTMVTVLSSASVVPLTPPSFCWGGNTLLSTSASSLGYVTFQWYFNGTAISGANTPTYLASVAGNYMCRITPPGGCNVNTPTMVVTEYPLPNPIITYNTTTGLMFTSNTFVTYQWYKNTIVIPGANTSAMYPSGNGDYKVNVTDVNGCHGFSTIYQLKNWIGTNGVNSVAGGEDVRIYPNPATSTIHIEGQGVERVVVSSVDGKSLIDVHSSDINIISLADGVYMISVYNADGQKVKVDKLVKTTN